MEELMITTEMREKINNFLGYELIKENEIGHHIYDEAPGLGRIGIESIELKNVITNKQLDGNGNIEWYKAPNPEMGSKDIKPFHCKLTTVSAKKSKILIASLFPEEVFDKSFYEENIEPIKQLRNQLDIVTAPKIDHNTENMSAKHHLQYNPMPKVDDLPFEGILFYCKG